ncbi:GMC oxidoreductase [Streptomyces sp. ISL-11]|uniref:GMC oxidoreductase n=1 Tax=Streptomyces sp. ISL-11 TaxID=2819174 RepID=UPI001BE64753|nr:GMC oxidoreductase [Streptomyces sp. ISL-11]MBT2384955.1 GMC family oxidoreductase [Streptomyces sp. ISL-11]
MSTPHHNRTKSGVDYVVIGSGFGGSVAALRLAEKGYSVTVLETGSRFTDDQLPRSARQARRFHWKPALGLHGMLRLTWLGGALAISGCAVGGGSLSYGAALMRPPPAAYRDPAWPVSHSWEAELRPYLDRATAMLGAVTFDEPTPAAALLDAYATEHAHPDAAHAPHVGIFLAAPGTTVPDPYFHGRGPHRTGCLRCGACMTGCRHGAKNTLEKNYLYLAERLGVRILPRRTAIRLRPRPPGDGSSGYQITHQRSGARLRPHPETLHAAAVVLAGGTLGTTLLLTEARRSGAMPHLSPTIGHHVRTNSETITAVTSPDPRTDHTHAIAVQRCARPDADTHIQLATYGPGANAQSWLFWAGHPLRHARRRLLHRLTDALRTARYLLTTRNWARRTLITLTMRQDAHELTLHHTRHRLTGRLRPRIPRAAAATTADRPGEHLTRWLARKTGGTVQHPLSQALAGAPTTVHLMGGAVLSDTPATGVTDPHHRVHGYHHLYICDASAVPANLGTNPALTITALAERAMDHIPPKPPAPDWAFHPLIRV